MKTVFDKIFLIFLATVLVFFGAWIYIAPRAEISESENRVLADFPKISSNTLLNGAFFEGLSAFYKDRFPLREHFTTLKCNIELLCGRGENNGVIVGKGGYLILRPDYESLDLYYKNLSEIERFCGSVTADTAVLFAPRAIDVLRGALPSGYPKDYTLYEIANSLNIEIINVNGEISDAAAKGEYVWFRTDHHFTSRGAYIAYKAICERFLVSALDYSDFVSEWIDGDFCGTTASRFASDVPCPDRVELMRYEGDGEFIVIDYDTGSISESLYDYEYADKKDKYSVFLGGNHGHIGVYREGEKRETMVVIKDSFANSVLPFLASHYDLEVYDLRYFKGNINDEISDISHDKMLLLYGIDTVVTDNNFQKINMG